MAGEDGIGALNQGSAIGFWMEYIDAGAFKAAAHQGLRQGAVINQFAASRIDKYR